MSAHYEKTGDSAYRVWFDDPENEDPNFGEQGNAFAVRYDALNVETVIDFAILEARKTLDPGTVFEIRGKYIPEGEFGHLDFGRIRKPREWFVNDWGVAWYYVKDLPKEIMERVPLVEAIRYQFGWLLIARLVA